MDDVARITHTHTCVVLIQAERENGDAFPRNDEGWELAREDVCDGVVGSVCVCVCLEGGAVVREEEEGKSEREPFRYGRMRSSRPARQRYARERERDLIGSSSRFHPS